MSTILEELEIEGIQSQTGAFANLLRMRDRSVGMHSERICSLAREVAKRFELSSRETQLVETASHLHDLGTIAIPIPSFTTGTSNRGGARSCRVTPSSSMPYSNRKRQVTDVVLHHHEWYRLGRQAMTISCFGSPCLQSLDQSLQTTENCPSR